MLPGRPAARPAARKQASWPAGASKLRVKQSVAHKRAMRLEREERKTARQGDRSVGLGRTPSARPLAGGSRPRGPRPSRVHK